MSLIPNVRRGMKNKRFGEVRVIQKAELLEFSLVNIPPQGLLIPESAGRALLMPGSFELGMRVKQSRLFKSRFIFQKRYRNTHSM